MPLELRIEALLCFRSQVDPASPARLGTLNRWADREHGVAKLIVAGEDEIVHGCRVDDITNESRLDMLPAMIGVQTPAPSKPESVRDLFPVLYRELRRLARSKLASGGRHTLLDTAALVHESFLRMQRAGGVQLKDREHFMAYAATTMRSVVIDFVRRRNADRRGGGAEHVTLDTRAAQDLGAADDEILAVHGALETLATVDARLVSVVEMRYFAGLSDADIGLALGVNERTVRRDWARARLLLAEMLGR